MSSNAVHKIKLTGRTGVMTHYLFIPTGVRPSNDIRKLHGNASLSTARRRARPVHVVMPVSQISGAHWPEMHSDEDNEHPSGAPISAYQLMRSPVSPLPPPSPGTPSQRAAAAAAVPSSEEEASTSQQQLQQLHVSTLVQGKPRGAAVGADGTSSGDGPPAAMWLVRPYRATDKEAVVRLQTEAFHEKRLAEVCLCVSLV